MKSDGKSIMINWSRVLGRGKHEEAQTCLFVATTAT